MALSALTRLELCSKRCPACGHPCTVPSWLGSLQTPRVCPGTGGWHRWWCPYTQCVRRMCTADLGGRAQLLGVQPPCSSSFLPLQRVSRGSEALLGWLEPKGSR